MSLKIVNSPIVPVTSVDPQPAAKHFDIVLGLDFHVLKVPWPITPCPITPFCALIFDPMDYIHFTIPIMPVYSAEEKGMTFPRDTPMGGTVMINDCYRGAAQGALWGMPSVPPLVGKLKGLGKAVKKLNLLHFVIPHPLFLLPKFFHPHEGQLSHGSETVKTQGNLQSTFLCRAYSCQDIGKILMNNPTEGFYLNWLTAVMVVLPFGKPVIVGGKKVEQELGFADLVNALMMLGLKHGLKFAMKQLGKLLTKMMKKIEARFPKFSKFRNAVQPYVCKYLGEPVDAASGHMASYLEGFTLPGPIPLVWEANYYSDSRYDGPMGKNIYHSYDISLLIDDEDQLVVMNDTAGRAVVFPALKPGTSFYNPIEKYELHRADDGEYFVSHKDGLYYYFNAPLADAEGHGMLRSIVNRNGFAIRFTYNEQGMLVQIRDSADRIITVENNEAGQITALLLPHPTLSENTFKAVSYTYTEDGNLNNMYNAEGFRNRFAWKDRYITARQFNDGTVFTFTYDEAGRCVAALGPEGLYSYTFEYLDGLTIATNSLGNSKSYFHHDGVVTRIVNSQGGEQLFTYDDRFNLIADSNELGMATTYAYDDKGNLTEVSLPGQGKVAISYNELNKPVSTTLPNGGLWTYEYDEAANLIKSVNPMGGVITYSYGPDGLMQSITNVMDQTTHLQYDRDYNLNVVELPNRNRISFYCDALGRNIEIVDVRGNSQYRKYNLLGDVTEVKNADGSVYQLTYDSMGNAITVKDQHSEAFLAYNFFGDVIRRTQGGTQISFVYNKEGELTQVINEHGESYLFELDTEGKVLTETGFDGLSRTYLRNAAGQVVRLTLPDGNEQGYEYTPSGQLSTVYYEADGSSEQYAYDQIGQLIAANNKEAAVRMKRDLLGNIIQESSNAHSLNSRYNAIGQRVHLKSSMGADLNLGYNAQMNWMEQISANGWHAELRYNDWGQEIQRSMPGKVEQLNNYDRVGRLTLQSIQGGSKRHDRQYSWDGDRLKSVRDSSTGQKSFRHDVYGNLAEVIYGDGTVEFKMPDAVGNLFETEQQKDRAYGKGGRLLKSKNATFAYDKLGNLTRKEERNGDVWLYEWNVAGMLAKVIRPDDQEVSFGYDALGRRVWKKFRQTTTHFVWDGNVPLHEYKTFDTEKEHEDNQLTTWIFEEDNFIPVAKIKREKRYSVVTDHLGTPNALYDEEGLSTWHVELDSYGRARLSTGSSLAECPFRYQGQYEDQETGLYYNRFRYYSPEEGVYISQDPIGLNGGFALYSYVEDCNFAIDPLGLSGMPKSGWNYGNMPKIDNYQLHHVIPRSKANHPALKAAGFDVDKPSNLIYLPKDRSVHPTRSVHNGWNKQHALYNADITEQLDDIYETGVSEGWSKTDFRNAVDDLRKDAKNDLRKGKKRCH
ncbi:RHS repeat-associated core domain-containing protein [Pedobacter duraquae]|uniref:RHS repeat-associated protein n=1 Tax=Pedobacter duraquae TaxID=425511 RepID=A0A4R6IGU0_9SPHI|nr:RHS repeat-associated core domain-containing protein [Pedobacter duraquae]TDO20927.1 RHS repeat-associated protein [Pedobacter duraquae]